MAVNNILSLKCPSCGAGLDITPHNARTACSYCGSVHLVKDLISSTEQNAAEHSIQPMVAQPEGIILQTGRNSLRITRRWFSLGTIPLLFFAIIWDGFLLFWYSMAFGAGTPVIFILFPLIHVGVGIFLTYSAIAGLVNRTYIDLDPQELSIWHSPLPWTGELTVPVKELKQFYVKQLQKSTSKGGTKIQYELHAVLQSGTSRKILGGLDSPDIPRYVEQQLERTLNIDNQPVIGEYRY